MKLNISEIEALLQLAFSDFCDFGASEIDKDRHLANWRAKIGYCKKHLTLIEE